MEISQKQIIYATSLLLLAILVLFGIYYFFNNNDDLCSNVDEKDIVWIEDNNEEFNLDFEMIKYLDLAYKDNKPEYCDYMIENSNVYGFDDKTIDVVKQRMKNCKLDIIKYNSINKNLDMCSNLDNIEEEEHCRRKFNFFQKYRGREIEVCSAKEISSDKNVVNECLSFVLKDPSYCEKLTNPDEDLNALSFKIMYCQVLAKDYHENIIS